MKRILILAIISMSFFSCKKSRICIKKTDLKIDNLNESSLSFERHRTIGIPEYFTPNSDNINDLFEIMINDTLVSEKQIRTSEENGFTDFRLSISNKCDLLFDSNDPYTPWDGINAGDLMKTGQYDYKIKVTWNDDSFEEIEGTFDLVN